jgi:hypothetical protein
MKDILNKTKPFLLKHTLVPNTSAPVCVLQHARFSPTSIHNRRIKPLKANETKLSREAVSYLLETSTKLLPLSLFPRHQNCLRESITTLYKVWKQMSIPPSTGISNRINYRVPLIQFLLKPRLDCFFS